MPSVHSLRAALTVALIALPATAAANADHLLITEVAADVVNYPENSEFVEIHNPTASDVVLNDGTAGYYIGDDHDIYWEIVNGAVSNSGADWLLGFPVGTVLPAHSFLVVTMSSDGFFSEFFPAGEAAFLSSPGAPQLLEHAVDADTVPDMVNFGDSTSMSLTNAGESVVLFYWDGVSDLVQDVDHVCWIDEDEIIDKSGIAIDGPDANATANTYVTDAGTGTAAADAGQGLSIQRANAIEIGETPGGGNGLTGHDESTEDWSASFVVGAATPGRFFIETDGDLSDLAAASEALATSAADGPGSGNIADFGLDGTVTELYATPEDTDGDGIADLLHVGVRGDFFGSAAGQNGTYIGIDVDPGSANGVTTLIGGGNNLADTTGALDYDITESGVALGTLVTTAGIAFDAVIGFTEDGCPTNDLCGLRGFGTDGVAGLLTDFAFLGDFAALSDLALGAVDPLLPGAPGTVYAAPDGFEFAVPLADLGNPTTVALAVWTSGDGPTTNGDPSPNTLPENGSNSFIAVQSLEAVVCVEMSGVAALWYQDLDADGAGDPATGFAVCGLPPLGAVSNGDDCDDNNPNLSPSAAESCDQLDNDCDGAVDEDFDQDADTFFDAADAGCAFIYPATDCDDSDATVYPLAVEICDGVDNNCDNLVDETFDLDGDGAYDGGDATCVATYGATAVDCNDLNPFVLPGGTESCDGQDSDCDGAIDEDFDADGDGYPSISEPMCSFAYPALDCDDIDPLINPGATEACANLVDDDCDGLSDIADPDCAAGDDDDSAGDDDDSAGDDDDATGDDDDSTGDDDDSTGDDDDSTGDDDDATGDDDDSTGDDDDATGDDDDDIVVMDDDDDDSTGCSCSTADSAKAGAWSLFGLALGLAARRRRGALR